MSHKYPLLQAVCRKLSPLPAARTAFRMAFWLFT